MLNSVLNEHGSETPFMKEQRCLKSKIMIYHPVDSRIVTGAL